MKISEMNFGQASEVMLRIAAPVANICDDEELSQILIDFTALQSETRIKAYGKTLPRLLTYCLQAHKADTYEIISALMGIPVGRIDKMNALELINGLRESWDEVLAGFFTRSAPAPKNADTK